MSSSLPAPHEIEKIGIEKIAARSRERAEAAKKDCSPDKMKREALGMKKGNFEFENALRKPGLSFICEIKKASPSRGIISEDFPYMDIAGEYERAGADAISVLTEPEYFLGGGRILSEVSKKVSLPLLRKDFIVDEYQIYESKALGASAILLIVSIVGGKLENFMALARELGLSVLTEAHGAEEIESAVSAGAKIIGVNNRNLKDFSVDMKNCEKLRGLVPPEILFVAESGIKTPEDVRAIEKTGADAVLIGEAMMKAKDRKIFLESLRGL